MEKVGPRQVARERAPLHQLLPYETLPRQFEVDVVLVRPPLLRPEDEQLRVHALAAERVHVRPACAGEVDGQMQDACVEDVQAANDTIGDREADALPGRTQRATSAARGRASQDP